MQNLKQMVENAKKDFSEKAQILRYDILRYDITITENEFDNLLPNGNYLYTHYCNDICDTVVYTALDYQKAHDYFENIYFGNYATFTGGFIGLDFSENEIPCTVYILCKVENNDICTVLDYSKDK